MKNALTIPGRDVRPRPLKASIRSIFSNAFGYTEQFHSAGQLVSPLLVAANKKNLEMCLLGAFTSLHALK